MDEEKIQDAEIENIVSEAGKSENAKKDFYIELALILILGILVGVAIKTEAAKRITVGFDDYKIERNSVDYDINKLQSDLTKKNLENDFSQNAVDETQNVNAGTCSAQ